ncbi:MAG: hypothetical protein HZB35_03990 [Nitrospirae bacterium]|nr:hypothetical protein [Nitrospirota bacterium]
MIASPETSTMGARDRPRWLAETIRLGLAPLILFLSGFFTAEFLLTGYYTWPRTSRALILTLTVAILSYEFVYQEQRVVRPDPAGRWPLRAVMYSCMIPYAVGVVALLALVRLGGVVGK